MSAAELHARTEAARVALDRACTLLVDPAPRNLEECHSILGAVISQLESFAAELDGPVGDPKLLAQAFGLRQTVRHAGFLLQKAAEHHKGWFQILRAKMGGYTAQGDPSEICVASRVCLRG